MSLFLKQQPDVEIKKKTATTKCGDQEEESNNQMWQSRRKQQPGVEIKKKKTTTRSGDREEESNDQVWARSPNRQEENTEPSHVTHSHKTDFF